MIFRNYLGIWYKEPQLNEASGIVSQKHICFFQKSKGSLLPKEEMVWKLFWKLSVRSAIHRFGMENFNGFLHEKSPQQNMECSHFSSFQYSVIKLQPLRKLRAVFGQKLIEELSSETAFYTYKFVSNQTSYFYKRFSKNNIIKHPTYSYWEWTKKHTENKPRKQKQS